MNKKNLLIIAGVVGYAALFRFGVSNFSNEVITRLKAYEDWVNEFVEGYNKQRELDKESMDTFVSEVVDKIDGFEAGISHAQAMTTPYA